MNPISELFEKYTNGILDDAGTEMLNRQLVELYFGPPGELSAEEQEYTEDLVIELFAKNQLKEIYAQKFKTKLEEDKLLFNKYALQKQLFDTAISVNEKRTQQLAESETSEEEEEEQLKEILQEVIQKVEAEKEKSSIKEWAENLRSGFMNFLEEMASRINLNPLQVRVALVVASFALIIGFAWLLFSPGNTELLTGPPGISPEKTNQPIASTPLQVGNDALSLKKKAAEKITNVIISFFEHEKSFDYSLARGGETTPAAADSFVMAAERYNEKNYGSCIMILNDLIKRNSFRDADTISEMNFYLGNCYLIKGITQDDDQLVKEALKSFESIDRENRYCRASLWYSVFAYAKLGNAAESSRLLDSMAQIRYFRKGKVNELRDSISKINKLVDK